MPPKEFLDWLEANYPIEDVARWRTAYQRRGMFGRETGWNPSWENDPVYQYWEQNVSPAGVQQQLATQFEKDIGADKLVERIQYLLDNTDMTEEEATELYTAELKKLYREYAATTPKELQTLGELGIPKDTQDYLNQYTTKADLANRINELDTDQETKANIYDSILGAGTTSGLAIREAKGRALTAQEKAQQGREERAQTLTEALNYTYNNPLVTQKDLAPLLMSKESESYLKGESDTIITKLANINKEARARSAREGQTAEAMLAGLQQPIRETRFKFPPIPEAATTGVAESFLKGTQLGEGTKLRSFIESQIPDIYRETQAERGEWWRRMNPLPETGGESFEEAQSRTGAEAERWAAIAAGAPSSEYAGETYYGPGGLKAIAERAYESAQGTLAGQRPEDYPAAWTPDIGRPQPVEEDPFAKALKRKDFMAAYYRRPGAGLSPRLTPAVRF